MPLSRRSAIAVFALLLLAGAVVGGLRWRAAAALVERGRALYAGEVPLPGRILGHDLDLPVVASRCINCHGGDRDAAGKGDTYAPRLDRATLAEPRTRRGGPASRYDARALCTLLSTGVDPAHVVIPRTMPRYRPSDDDCAALWAYLSAQ